MEVDPLFLFWWHVAGEEACQGGVPRSANPALGPRSEGSPTQCEQLRDAWWDGWDSAVLDLTSEHALSSVVARH